jgi:epoxide hydrolase
MSDLEMRPFRVDIPERAIAELKQRLALTRFPDRETVDDWSQGVPLSYARELKAHWETEYDCRRIEARLNAHEQFVTTIDGLDIHFIHARSPHANARPLLITHGWPGSVVEFLEILGPLTEPSGDDTAASDAFHVVCPSLPGYGFSGKPTVKGWGAAHIAEVWAELMARLGYSRYFAQGGDWGSAVTTRLAQQDAEHCSAIHLNMVVPAASSDDVVDAREREALGKLEHYRRHDSGYAKQQSTRPQTLGYALADSPMGQAMWILEKFWAWTDCSGHPENAISRDQLLDNVMLYWLTGSAASSARLYWESLASFDAGRVTVPVGVSIFPKEIYLCSRRWAERKYERLFYWGEPERGGHFAAFEQPALFVEELRRCFRLVT